MSEALVPGRYIDAIADSAREELERLEAWERLADARRIWAEVEIPVHVDDRT